MLWFSIVFGGNSKIVNCYNFAVKLTRHESEGKLHITHCGYAKFPKFSISINRTVHGKYKCLGAKQRRRARQPD
jgi:hypothetical protein